MSGGLSQPHLVRLSPAGDRTAGEEASATFLIESLGEAEPEDGPGLKLKQTGSISFPESPHCPLPKMFPLV